MDTQQASSTPQAPIPQESPVTLHLPPHTHVVIWGNSAWPAWSHEEYVIVDLRLFNTWGDPTPENMEFRPEDLARAGVPDEVILEAADSTPPGFAVLRR